MNNNNVRSNKFQPIVEAFSGLGLVGFTTYQGSRLGSIMGQWKHKMDLETVDKEIKRLIANEAAGNKYEIVEYKTSFKHAGKESENTEYRPIPIEHLKAEQVQFKQHLNKEGCVYDYTFGIIGATIGLALPVIIFSKLGDFIRSNIYEPVSEGLAEGQLAAFTRYQQTAIWLNERFGKKPCNNQQKPKLD